MDDLNQSALYEPTQDERTYATLAHALQMVGWWIAPLIIFFVKSDSKFVRFHALQALLLQICQIIFMFAFMIVWFAVIFGTIAQAQAHPSGPPPFFFILAPLVWLGWMAWFVIMIILVVMYSIKAGHGEWKGYPVLGRLAAHFLGLQLPY